MIKALLLLASVAFGQQDPTIPAAFRDFSGGYVDTVESAGLQPNQSPSTENGVIDDPIGAFKPRNGFVRCGSTPSGNAPTGLYEYVKTDGTKRLIVTDNSTVWQTADCRAFTSIKTSGLNSSQPVYFSTIRDKVWAVNGSTHPFTWDGSTTTILDGRASTPSPAPPRCAFIEFWKERVWCARTSANPSIVQFSALTDTAGNDVDPSTGSLSWPASNAFYIDQNGGSPIYGMKAYRDRLYIFKDNGIWEIQFNNDFDNAVRKTYASAGSRFQSAIGEIDGILYFVGKDGIYAFDGNESIRISGQIEGKFAALNQPQISTQYKLWSTQSEFSAGTLSSATVINPSGSVTISSKAANITNGTFENGTNLSPWSCTYVVGTAPNTHPYARTCVAISSNAATGYNPTGGTWSLGAIGKCAVAVHEYYLFNVSGSTVASGTLTTTLGSFQNFTLDTGGILGQTVYLHLKTYGQFNQPTDDEIHVYSGTFTVVGSSLTFGGVPVTGNPCGWGSLDDFTNSIYFASATWTSEVYNAVSVSSWTGFDANAEANGGSITYEYRTGTSEANTTAIAFAPITPGVSLGTASANTYIQIRASLFSDSLNAVTPRLDDVTVTFTQGGTAANRLYLAGWKNRPWITASSGTATTNNLALVKSRLPLNSWMLYAMQIGPMTRYNDAFYAGASTHSAIYRMDYGTNDDGAAIPWYWESRDEMWGAPNNKKQLREMNIDFKAGTAEHLSFGYSRNYGTTYYNRTIDASGTGRGSSTQFVNGGQGFSYRFRFGSSTLDESATITGLSGWALPIKKRE